MCRAGSAPSQGDPSEEGMIPQDEEGGATLVLSVASQCPAEC